MSDPELSLESSHSVKLPIMKEYQYRDKRKKYFLEMLALQNTSKLSR